MRLFSRILKSYAVIASYTQFIHQLQNFTTKEIYSQIWGRCVTLWSEHEFLAREYLTLSFAPGGPPAYVFFHSPGEDFWIISDVFPYEIATEVIEEPSDCTIRKKVGAT